MDKLLRNLKILVQFGSRAICGRWFSLQRRAVVGFLFYVMAFGVRCYKFGDLCIEGLPAGCRQQFAMELGLQSPLERFTNYNVHTVLAHIRGWFGMDPIWVGREDTVEGKTLAVGNSKLRCWFNKIKQITRCGIWLGPKKTTVLASLGELKCTSEAPVEERVGNCMILPACSRWSIPHSKDASHAPKVNSCATCPITKAGPKAGPSHGGFSS